MSQHRALRRTVTAFALALGVLLSAATGSFAASPSTITTVPAGKRDVTVFKLGTTLTNALSAAHVTVRAVGGATQLPSGVFQLTSTTYSQDASSVYGVKTSGGIEFKSTSGLRIGLKSMSFSNAKTPTADLTFGGGTIWPALNAFTIATRPDASDPADEALLIPSNGILNGGYGGALSATDVLSFALNSLAGKTVLPHGGRFGVFSTFTAPQINAT